MSRRSRHWRKVAKQCGGDPLKLEAVLPSVSVAGTGRWLDKGRPGSRVTLPMSREKHARVRKAAKPK